MTPLSKATPPPLHAQGQGTQRKAKEEEKENCTPRKLCLSHASPETLKKLPVEQRAGPGLPERRPLQLVRALDEAGAEIQRRHTLQPKLYDQCHQQLAVEAAEALAQSPTRILGQKVASPRLSQRYAPGLLNAAQEATAQTPTNLALQESARSDFQEQLCMQTKAQPQSPKCGSEQNDARRLFCQTSPPQVIDNDRPAAAAACRVDSLPRRKEPIDSYQVVNTFVHFRSPQKSTRTSLALSEPRNLRPFLDTATTPDGAERSSLAFGSTPSTADRASCGAWMSPERLRSPRRFAAATPSTVGRAGEEWGAAEALLAPGATVEVLDALTYMYAEEPQLNYELPAGCIGVVVDVDGDGHSVVDWPLIGRQWLMRADLAKVRVQPRGCAVPVQQPASAPPNAQLTLLTVVPAAWCAAPAGMGGPLPAQAQAEVARVVPPVQPQAPGVPLLLAEHLSPVRRVGARCPVPLSLEEHLPSALQPRRLFS